ncbi:MAG: acetate kinase [Arcobacteraceae bacterium]
MTILVLNSGSSSIKYKLFDKDTMKELYSGIAEEVTSHKEAINKILNDLKTDGIIPSGDDIFCVGHRVVHGGEVFTKATLVDESVMEKIDELSALAPLHNPAHLAGMRAVQDVLGDIKQVIVCDTAFHQTMPAKASMYPIPHEYYEKYAIKKYGFHGTSHEYVSRKAAEQLGLDYNTSNFITMHLGNGASVCCIKNGTSQDTSMGFTPLEGLMMGTRSGDIDPTVVTFLQEKLDLTPQEVNNLLNKESGFKGVTGTSDLREVFAMAESGNEDAAHAIELFTHRILKYVGAYLMTLGHVDAIVFTGGIGENAQKIRDIVTAKTDKFNLKSLVIATNEELAIAEQSKALLV